MPLSEPLQRFLVDYGYSPKQVASFERNTRLYHDLGWVHDSFDEDVWAIFKHFNIQTPNRQLGPYYPGLATWDDFVTTFFGWTNWGRRAKDRYKPLTFGMIEQAIEKGAWDFD